MAGAASFIWCAFSSSVMRLTRSAARSSNESDSFLVGGGLRGGGRPSGRAESERREDAAPAEIEQVHGVAPNER